MFRVSLRYGIPLLIVVFTAVLAAYSVQKEWGAAEAVVRGEAVSQMISRITLLQKQFSYSYATGDHERIAQEMSLLGSAPEPQIAILADDTGSFWAQRRANGSVDRWRRRHGRNGRDGQTSRCRQ